MVVKHAENPIALKEIQLRLGVPQHVLIHLCEKGVIEPDFVETSGRGRRREFSRRNLFEFALALALRRFELPVATTAMVVRLVRAFGRAVAKAAPGFTLPDSLLERKIELKLHFYDGELLVLSVRGSGFRKPLFLSARVPELSEDPSVPPRVLKLEGLPGKFQARLEVDLSEVARNTAK